MEVILGPMAAESGNRGSATGPGSIPKLMGPLKKRNRGKWIAGHLLNDDLGGSGTDPKNLTPLTATANKQHSGLEQRIKRACIAARQYHDQNKNAPNWKCVRYTVTVHGHFGDKPPYSGAPLYISAKAEAIEVKKGTKTPVRGVKSMIGSKTIYNRHRDL